MENLEFKSLPLELSDVDLERRIAVIKHASYGNVDKVGDISRQGMFDKSWKEDKSKIEFRLDHDEHQRPGKIADVWDDSEGAYSKVKFNNTTLGRDMLELAAEQIITNASFGFRPIRANTQTVKGRKVRELKEVYHGETSLIYRLKPVNPEAGVVMVQKAMESDEFKALSSDEQDFLKDQIRRHHDNLDRINGFSRGLKPTSDMYTMVDRLAQNHASNLSDMKQHLKWNMPPKELKARLKKLEDFCRNSTASDETIQHVEAEVKALNQIISSFDTANATDHVDDPPAASEEVNAILTRVHLLTARL